MLSIRMHAHANVDTLLVGCWHPTLSSIRSIIARIISLQYWRNFVTCEPRLLHSQFSWFDVAKFAQKPYSTCAKAMLPHFGPS